MNKPKWFDTFLYQYLKCTGHSPNDISVQPVEKMTYQENSSTRFKIIKRHETELKWIRFLQNKTFLLEVNDNIYHVGNVSKMADLTFFLFWNFGNVNNDYIAYGKREPRNEKCALLKEPRLHGRICHKN